MFALLTDDARQAIVHAQDEARSLCHGQIDVGHLLAGLFATDSDGVAHRVLADAGVKLEAVRTVLEQEWPRLDTSPTGNIPFTPELKKVLQLSVREALRLGHNHVGTEHLLLAIIQAGGQPASLLSDLGDRPVNLAEWRRRVIRALAERLPEPVTGRLPISLDQVAGEETDGFRDLLERISRFAERTGASVTIRFPKRGKR